MRVRRELRESSESGGCEPPVLGGLVARLLTMRRETRSHSSQQGDTEHDAPPSDGPEAADMVAELESNPSACKGGDHPNMCRYAGVAAPIRRPPGSVQRPLEFLSPLPTQCLLPHSGSRTQFWPFRLCYARTQRGGQPLQPEKPSTVAIPPGPRGVPHASGRSFIWTSWSSPLRV